MSDKKFMVVKKSDGQNIEILPTYFERKVGEKINGREIIAILNNENEKRLFISEWNRLVRKENNYNRKKYEYMFWSKVIKECPQIAELLNDIKNF